MGLRARRYGEPILRLGTMRYEYHGGDIKNTSGNEKDESILATRVSNL